MLVVSLLQDGDEEVRDDMATSVGIILSSLTHSAGMYCLTLLGVTLEVVVFTNPLRKGHL